MSFLSHFRILTKILAVVMLLSVVAAGITWYAVNALGALNDGAGSMATAALRSLDAARMNQNVLALNRAEFRAALDPRVENRAEAHTVVVEQLKEFAERFEEVGKTSDDLARNMFPAVKEAFAAYKLDLDESFRTIDGVKDFQMTETAQRLRDATMKSRASAEKLRVAVRAVADRMNNRVSEFSKKASDEYESASRLMMIAATIGIVFATVLGFLVGQFGIAKPMRALVGLLQRLAKGDDIEITGTERKDEIGETALAGC